MWLCKRDLSKECEGKYKNCVDCVLDKIRAEIEQVSITHYFEHGEYYGEDTRQERIVNFDTVMQIIDKHKAESEVAANDT